MQFLWQDPRYAFSIAAAEPRVQRSGDTRAGAENCPKQRHFHGCGELRSFALLRMARYAEGREVRMARGTKAPMGKRH